VLSRERDSPKSVRMATMTAAHIAGRKSSEENTGEEETSGALSMAKRLKRSPPSNMSAIESVYRVGIINSDFTTGLAQKPS
jgi:hypothetical protein